MTGKKGKHARGTWWQGRKVEERGAMGWKGRKGSMHGTQGGSCGRQGVWGNEMRKGHHT